MKLLVFFLAVLSFPLHAQWNVNADNYTTGKVGIGTGTTREKLDVVGTSAGAGSAVTKIRIYQPANLVGADANLVPMEQIPISLLKRETEIVPGTCLSG